MERQEPPKYHRFAELPGLWAQNGSSISVSRTNKLHSRLTAASSLCFPFRSAAVLLKNLQNKTVHNPSRTPPPQTKESKPAVFARSHDQAQAELQLGAAQKSQQAASVFKDNCWFVSQPAIGAKPSLSPQGVPFSTGTVCRGPEMAPVRSSSPLAGEMQLGLRGTSATLLPCSTSCTRL